MDQPSPEIKYEKMSGFATTKGQMYEAKVSALLFLRGINSGIDFQLASNVKGAGALDDVVFRFKGQSDEWITCFMQLKHKEKTGINREKLMSPTGPFSLQMYCESYEVIKAAMSATERQVLFDGNIERSFFVIFTNAKSNAKQHSDLGEERRATEQIETFLETNSGKIFSFDPDGVTDPERAVSDSLHDCADCGRDFLKRLRIFAAQPNEAEFDNLIKKELVIAVCKFKNIDIDRLFVCFMDNVKTWCEEKESYVLDRGSSLLLSARDRVLAETYSLYEIKENKLDLVFKEEALSAMVKVLSGESPVVHIGYSEQTSRLTFTKLLQTFETSTYLFFGSKSFLSNQIAVTSEWGRGRHNTLIVSVNNRDMATDQNHFDKIVDLCKIAVHSKKRLVILTNSKVETDKSFEYFEDFFKFSSLTTASRNDFLSTKFHLQGRSISLEAFLADSRDDDVLSGSFVVEIIESGSRLSVGSAITGPDKHYLPRSLHPPKAKVLRSLFQVETLPETIAIVNSSTSDIVKTFFQSDAYLFEQYLCSSFVFAGDSRPQAHNTNESMFLGGCFVLGKFECSFVGLSSDKPSALRCRPLKDGRPITACCFLFVFQGTSESVAEKLAALHRTSHFITMNDFELTLSKSLYDSDFLRGHIELLRPKDLVNISERVVIVCGEPGMGKTTFMRHLAQMTKEEHPKLWVILISLNDHTQLFAEGKHENAFEFLSAAAEIKSSLEQSMLKVALEIPEKVVVILDGFDEIAPKYIDHCCQLLSNIIKTQAYKVWVTTRISVKSELELHLSMSATRLCKFNEDDQRSFLKQSWADIRESALTSGKKVLSDKELDEFINRLLRSLRDWGNDLLGIPLQARIMAEVFSDHLTSQRKTSPLPEKLDLLKLLDLFIEKKLEVYVQDKLKVKPSDGHYETVVKSIKATYSNNHMAAAICLTLPENYGNEWKSKNLIVDLTEFLNNIKIGEEKTGFINSIINGKAHFIHRVFAEYFVAKWFASHPEEYAMYLVKESFHAYRGGYVLSRFLCDLILAKDCELHTAVLYGDVSKVKELLTAGADVNARDLGGRTPLHLTAAFGHMDSTQAKHVEILDLLIQTPGIDFEITDELVNGTPLRYADMMEYWLMIEKLLEQNVNKACLDINSQQKKSLNFTEFIFSNDSLKLLECFLDINPGFQSEKMFTSLNLTFKGDGLLANACQYGKLRITKLLIERGYNINGQPQSIDATHFPPLHCACLGGHLEIIKLLLKASKCKLGTRLPQTTAENNSDYVNRKSVSGHTALLVASEVDVEVVAFLIDNGADVESQDAGLCNCLHYAAGKNRKDILEVIVDALKRKKKLELVNASNYMQATPLHFAANAGFIESVQFLVSAGGKMSTDCYKQTPLMLAARNGHFEVVEFLLVALENDKNANGLCNSLSRTGWLNKKDKDGWTALTLAESFGFQNVVKLLTDRGANTRRRDGPDTGLPKDYKHEEDTLRGWKTGYLYCVHFNCLSNAGNSQIVSTYLDDKGNTMLHIAARCGYLELVNILFKLGAKVTSTNSAGQTPLMMAAGRGYYKVVEYLLSACDKSKSIAKDEGGLKSAVGSKDLSKEEFINMQDCNGVTAVYHAAFRCHKNTVELLLEHGANANIFPHSGGKLSLVFSSECASVSWSCEPPQWVTQKAIKLKLNIEVVCKPRLLNT